MASFPKIDRPCPLGVTEQARIQGNCDRCGQHVHVLDAMAEDERRRLMATANGSICVSYRRRPAIAAMLILGATAVHPVDAREAATCPTSQTSPASSACASGDSLARPNDLPQSVSGSKDLLISPVESNMILTEAVVDKVPRSHQVTVFVGGVSTPQSAQWIEERELPELPVRGEDER